jgi:uncharacterized OB-fold protein
MKAGLSVHRCQKCRSIFFPQRFLCPKCGADHWAYEDVFDGVVEETTLVRHARGRPDWVPRPIGTVRLADELAVVAGLEEKFPEGTAVKIFTVDGAPFGKRVE